MLSEKYSMEPRISPRLTRAGSTRDATILRKLALIVVGPQPDY